MWGQGSDVKVSGVPDRRRAHEGVAIVIKRRLWGSITGHKCVSGRGENSNYWSVWSRYGKK